MTAEELIEHYTNIDYQSWDEINIYYSFFEDDLENKIKHIKNKLVEHFEKIETPVTLVFMPCSHVYGKYQK